MSSPINTSGLDVGLDVPAIESSLRYVPTSRNMEMIRRMIAIQETLDAFIAQYQHVWYRRLWRFLKGLF